MFSKILSHQTSHVELDMQIIKQLNDNGSTPCVDKKCPPWFFADFSEMVRNFHTKFYELIKSLNLRYCTK